jgi:4-carboxymuconolactone decarboxylase
MAMRVQHLGEFIRYDTIFGPALVEVAILVTAKHWRSHYEWWDHRRLAEAANLDAAIINAIRDGQPLPPVEEKVQVIYDYAKSLHETRAVPMDLHNRMLAAWGPRGVSEVIGTCGYYTPA